MNVLLLLSWRGALMVLIITGLDRIFAPRITARTRRVWWLLVPPAFLLTLSLPVLPARHNAPGSVGRGLTADSMLVSAVPIRPEAPAGVFLPSPAAPRNLLIAALAGSGVYLLIVAARTYSAVRFWGRERPCEDAALLAALEGCKGTAGVTTPVGLIVSDRVPVPLILGWLRPRIVLPRALVASSSSEQLRGVLFHELAHHRFCDIPCTWLFTLVCGLHWFNPAAHLALRGWARFREEAADEAAIGWLGQPSGLPYGETLLHVLRHSNRPPSTHFLTLAIVESVTQLSKRLTMIKHYERRSAHPLFTATILLVAATGILLRPVRAQDASPSRAAPPAGPVVAPSASVSPDSPAEQRRALIDLFRQREYTLPESMVDERVAVIVRENFGGNQEAFRRQLQAQGFSEEKFRSVEREGIMVQAMRYQLQKEAKETEARAFILPKIKVPGLRLADAVELLTAEVHRLKPKAQRMSIRLDPESTPAFNDAQVTLDLSDVSLLEVVQAMAQQTGGKLSASGDGFGIRPGSSELGAVEPPAGASPARVPGGEASPASTGSTPLSSARPAPVPDAESVSRLAASLANAAAEDQYGVAPFTAANATAELVQGRWFWQATTGYGHSDLVASVSFSERGNEPTVRVRQLVLTGW